MPRSGLRKESVVEAAARLIERCGVADFSMRALAESLNIKTASLYNHISSMDALLVDVCAYALKLQQTAELSAIEGQNGVAGVRALATAYRSFAKEHRELYRLIMTMAANCGDHLGEASSCIVEPFLKVLEFTSFSMPEKMHWQRVLRGVLHGFVAQEDAGFFSHFPQNVEESFEIAVECYIDGLTQAEKRKQK